jgi:hypothetical protein
MCSVWTRKTPQITFHVGKGLKYKDIVRHVLNIVADAQAQVLLGNRPHHLATNSAPHPVSTDQKIGREHLSLGRVQAPALSVLLHSGHALTNE